MLPDEVRRIARRLRRKTVVDAEEAESLAWFGLGVAVVQGVPPGLLVLAGYRSAIDRVRLEDRHRRQGWFRMRTTDRPERFAAAVDAGMRRLLARDAVDAVLRRYHGHSRAILRGTYVEGKSQATIGRELGIRRKTVSYHARMIRELREAAQRT